jgi:hypothetical protein
MPDFAGCARCTKRLIILAEMIAAHKLGLLTFDTKQNAKTIQFPQLSRPLHVPVPDRGLASAPN